MTQGFDELKEITSAMNRSFKQGAASRQAEIDKIKSDNQLSESQIGQACVKWKEIAEKRQAEIDELKHEYHGVEIGRDCFLKQLKIRHKSEIDELKRELGILQGMHNAVSLTAGDLVDGCDELQKRVDKALDYVFGLYCTGDLDTERLENILKGDGNG